MVARRKKPHVKFLADENFPRILGKFLSTKGFSVLELPKSMRGKELDDSIIMAHATKLGRILLTEDHDFMHDDTLVEKIQESPGVVHIVRADPPDIVGELLIERMLDALSPKKIRGKVLDVSLAKAAYQERKRKH